jgi:hypothetical protein
VSESPSVSWRFWLCRSFDLGQIAELTTNAHQKKLNLILNQAGICTFWMHLEDEKCQYIQEHTTCIVAYRNGKAIWSGPIYKATELANETTNTLSVTAFGWFQNIIKRIVHTGLEWEEIVVIASGRSIIRYPEEKEKEIAEIEAIYVEVVASGFYTPLATESALELFYSVEKSQFSSIAADIITRANIDSPTLFTVGLVPEMNSLNFKIPRFHPVGELITQLASIESGFDWHIDPLTRKFNIYWNEIRGGIAGLGRDRGAGVRFTFPGNCTSAERTGDGTKTQNRTEAVGQYGVGKSEDVESVSEYGLFEASENLSDVVNIDILIAYAQAQDEYLKVPFKVISFIPKSINSEDLKTAQVPRPFEDYEIGDIVYTTIEKGNRFKVGIENPQPVRIYSMDVEIDDSGTEKISSIQTTYTA